MTDKTPNYATLKAHYEAFECLHANPLPDTRRNALFAALIPHMNIDRVCWPSTRRLSAITRISKPTVLKLLNEFDAKALIEFIDPPETGRRARRIRLHPERLGDAFAVKPELTAKDRVAVKPELTASNAFAVSGGYRKVGNVGCVAVKMKAVCGKSRVVLKCKQEGVGKPKATAADGTADDNTNASDPPTPEKSDVQGKTDPPSNDAVQSDARGPPTPEQHQFRAREADANADCDGALRSKSGGLYLPWGPYLDPRRVRALRADLVGMIGALATLEAWPKGYRDEVLTRAIRGPLSDLLPNVRYFERRVIDTQCKIAAAELRDSRTWHGEGFEKRMTDKPMTTRSAKKYRNRKQA